MIEFILGAFLYARLKKKYSLKQVFKHWSIYLPLLFGLFYIFLECTVWMRWYWFVPYSKYIKTATLLSYLPLVIHYKLYYNYNIKTYKLSCILKSPMVVAGICLWLGSTLNNIAISLNYGYMPVFADVGYWTGYITPKIFTDGLHVVGTAQSKAIPICDIFDIGYSIWSVGDVLIRVYAFIILFYSIKYSTYYKNNYTK